jgi:exodeoxyribonuclease VII large subunit
VVGVKRLADYLKRKLEVDAQLRAVSVRGEVSNLRISPRGSYNFDLKEGDVVLACFAWPDDGARFPTIKNGVAIVATGAVTTYEQKSTYQLRVASIVREGVGDVHTLFEERKKKLAAEGLFDPSRKRPLPAFPFRVALVSSRGANGAIDFVTLLRERAPHVEIVWCETLVQGPNAPPEIVRAIARASREDVDAIVVTRGGGSFEDLFAFSDENVVRAIARARHPVVSAIGHTVDQQLCDFAADVHVETPSAAAKALGPAARDVRVLIGDRAVRLERATDLCLERLRNRLGRALVRSRLSEPRTFFAPLVQRLDDADAALEASASAALRARERSVRDLARSLLAHDPSARLARRSELLATLRLRLDTAAVRRIDRLRRTSAAASERLDSALQTSLARAARRLEMAAARLDGNNPEAILQRGYAIVTYGGGIVRDPAAVPAGARIEARVARGTISARVEGSVTIPERETDGNERIG